MQDINLQMQSIHFILALNELLQIRLVLIINYVLNLLINQHSLIYLFRHLYFDIRSLYILLALLFVNLSAKIIQMLHDLLVFHLFRTLPSGNVLRLLLKFRLHFCFCYFLIVHQYSWNNRLRIYRTLISVSLIPPSSSPLHHILQWFIFNWLNILNQLMILLGHLFIALLSHHPIGLIWILLQLNTILSCNISGIVDWIVRILIKFLKWIFWSRLLWSLFIDFLTLTFSGGFFLFGFDKQIFIHHWMM